MGFTADWLSLREPADLAARNADLLARAAACVPADAVVLDLGSGTGSTARAFAAMGHDALRWRFLDNDATLLAVARQTHPGAECVQGDLGAVEDLPLQGVGLVTASALLDLMPLPWVAALAGRLRAAAIPFYGALSYDGHMGWTPAHGEDAAVTARFNAHQRGNKGIGAALGPDSGAQSARVFAAEGFEVTLADSPWVIGPDQAALHAALLEGIAAAATEAGHATADVWLAARRASVAQSQAEIGHSDLLALPPS
ncbi:hypothetical protein P775_24200 [Puniceibacterium antarcticum]|uniref:Methyltransferase domain-containing protein n=1 Tax=Puniceibacterium antarcticum TaxID=1206336 RepID=A0A2G8R6Z2_9RHOB|nr:class I SAM-dependent methyltransferase [Puniceibacterium antarcticum]PIL17309.1 hypothetical protein P775_24200 [Puniceibacterium antarcticum]